MKTLEQLEAYKGRTMWRTGQDRHIRLFDTKEECREYYNDYGMRGGFKPIEVEVHEILEVWMEEHTGNKLCPIAEQMLCSQVRQLSMCVLSCEKDLGWKDERFPEVEKGVEVDGMWRWVIRRPNSKENLYESDWRMPEHNA